MMVLPTKSDILSCNLSPRGDGNIRGIVDVYSVLGCNLSPRGDGNISMLVDFMLEMVAIYPREGTETSTLFFLR